MRRFRLKRDTHSGWATEGSPLPFPSCPGRTPGPGSEHVRCDGSAWGGGGSRRGRDPPPDLIWVSPTSRHVGPVRPGSRDGTRPYGSTPPIRQMIRHSSVETGCTERREFFTRTRFSSPGSVLQASRPTGRTKGRTARTATQSQRGSSVVLSGALSRQTSTIRRSPCRCSSDRRTQGRPPSWPACCCAPDSCVPRATPRPPRPAQPGRPSPGIGFGLEQPIGHQPITFFHS